MPANLTPMYHKAERQFRAAATAQERVAYLERMLTLLPKHKGTDKLQADLRHKLKELRAEVAAEKNRRTGGTSPQIARQGAARAVVIGPPNGGKSCLVAALTNAAAEVAPYPFTTQRPTPGMLKYEDIRFQLIDTPPIAAGSIPPDIYDLIRNADVGVLCVDASDIESLTGAEVVIAALRDRSLALVPPDEIRPEAFGSTGTLATCLVLTRGLHEDAVTFEEMLSECESLADLPRVRFDPEGVPLKQVCVEFGRVLLDASKVVRVYTKRPGEPADRSDPLVLPIGATVLDVAADLHDDLPDRVSSARLWRLGDEAPSSVGCDYNVCDGDLVELHTR